MLFPLSLSPSARCRFDGQLWFDETYPSNDVGRHEAEAYDARSHTFDIARALELRRPGFTNPLRALGKETWFLELAAGRAAHSLSLLRDGYRVIVSDISPESVRWVKDASHKLGIGERGHFVVIDADHLPFADQSLDGVFLTAALHHFPSPERTLAECRRALRPGGVLLIGYEPARWSYIVFSPLWKFIKKIVRRGVDKKTVSIADDVTMGFSLPMLKNLAEQVGFIDVEVRGVDFLEKIYEHVRVLVDKLRKKPDSEYRPGSPFLRKIDAKLGKLPLVRRLSWNYDLLARVPAATQEI